MGLEVLEGRSGSMTDLPSSGGELDTSWLSGYADLKELPDDPEAAFFHHATEGAIDIGGNADTLSARLNLKMQSRESALNIEKVAIGFIALADMRNEEDRDTQFLLDHITLELRDTELRLKFDAPMAEAIQVLLNKNP
jgi:hypothetical protein